MKRRLVFIACCSIYKIIIDILRLIDTEYEIIGFIDDNELLSGTKLDNIPVLGTFIQIDSIVEKYRITDAAICLPEGYLKTRKLYFDKIKSIGINTPNFIHSRAIVSDDVIMGEGVIVCANAVINPGSTIGNDDIIWTGSTIDHDNQISDHVYISPGVHLAGGVKIGECTMLGTGAIVTPLVSIGSNVNIGAASLVNKNVPDNVTAYGIPAKIIR